MTWPITVRSLLKQTLRGFLEGTYKRNSAEALRNYREWMGTPTMLELDCRRSAEGHAVLDCGKYHNLWNEEEISKVMTDLAVEDLQFWNDRHGRDIRRWHQRTKKREEENNKFISRLSMALFGGAALIAPMLIMTLHPTRLTSLLTTSVFVLAVGVALAWWMKDAASKDIMGSTAAYAAVLVVFVGTGGGSSS
jgi:hypothetical protein